MKALGDRITDPEMFVAKCLDGERNHRLRQRKRALRERGATAAAEIVWRPQQPLWRALNRADTSGDAAANVTAKRGRAGPGPKHCEPPRWFGTFLIAHCHVHLYS